MTIKSILFCSVLFSIPIHITLSSQISHWTLQWPVDKSIPAFLETISPNLSNIQYLLTVTYFNGEYLVINFDKICYNWIDNVVSLSLAVVWKSLLLPLRRVTGSHWFMQLYVSPSADISCWPLYILHTTHWWHTSVLWSFISDNVRYSEICIPRNLKVNTFSIYVKGVGVWLKSITTSLAFWG